MVFRINVIRMLGNNKHKLSCKAWLEYKGKPLIGKGGAEILETIDKERSISKAAQTMGMSYRYVWNYIQDIQSAMEEKILETHKGGKSGGGGARLTDLGRSLLGEYKQVESYLVRFLSDQESLDVKCLKSRVQNQFKGKVLAVEKGVLTSKVKVQIEMPITVISVITKGTVEELDLKVGDEVTATLKSTEIMIAR